MICAVLAAAAAIAGCGGSKHSSSSSSSSTAPTGSTGTTTTTSSSAPATTKTRTSAPTTTAGRRTTSTRQTTPPPRTTTTTTTTSGSGSASGGVAPQPTAGGGAHRTKVDKPAGGSANARVPATFTISRSGSVSPPTVSAPAFLAISLTVVSGDGKPHQVRLLTLAPHVLHVPAGGRATTLIGGLKAGSYAIQIDGKPKAKLVIGGEPGP